MTKETKMIVTAAVITTSVAIALEVFVRPLIERTFVRTSTIQHALGEASVAELKAELDKRRVEQTVLQEGG